MKRAAFLILCIFFLNYLLLFPQDALTYARAGLLLWFDTLLPSMLPFFVFSGLLLSTNLLDRLVDRPKAFWKTIFALSPQGAYAWMLGILCGYPMGAKITADLYKEQRISRQEALYLLTFSSYPGPAFLSSYLCTGLFQRPDLFLPSCGILYLSSFLCSLFTRILYKPLPETSGNFRQKKEISSSPPLGELLDISIMNGFEAITKLGGYVILFSILQGMLKPSLRSLPNMKYLIPGCVEITTGLAELTASPWDISLLFPAALAFTAFGGLCVAAQTKSMLNHTDLPLSPYLLGKLLCSVCTYLLACFLVKVVKIVI